MHRALGCPGAVRFHAPLDGVRDVPDLDWSHCPIDLLGSPHFEAVHMLDQLARISPLSGWPDRYQPWAICGLIALRRHQEA